MGMETRDIKAQDKKPLNLKKETEEENYKPE